MTSVNDSLVYFYLLFTIHTFIKEQEFQKFRLKYTMFQYLCTNLEQQLSSVSQFTFASYNEPKLNINLMDL